MKLTLVLVVLSVSYGIAAGNILWDLVKGVSKGIADSYKESEAGRIKHLKAKLQKRIEHPKFKHHKDKLEKLIHKAGNDIDIFHKKLVRRYGPKGAKLAKEKADKHTQEIMKWMSTLTKNDTDGDEPHNFPFIPHLALHKDDVWGERRKEKADKIFAGLKKMWKTKLGKKNEKPIPEKHLLGEDYRKVIPEFVKEEFQKEGSSHGNDELKNLHKIDHPEQDGEHLSTKDAGEVLQSTKRRGMFGLEEELKKKQELVNTGKEELLGQSNEEKQLSAKDLVAFMKVINRESDDLEKTVEELIPFLGQETEKNESKIELTDTKQPMHALLTAEIKKTGGAPESSRKGNERDEDRIYPGGMEGMLERERLRKAFGESRQVEKEVSEEQKKFQEAEKLWESEIEKNAMEQLKQIEKQEQKAKEKKEVEEELKKPDDVTPTPPDDIVTTAAPEIEVDEDFKPIVYFNFDESKNGDNSKEEEFPVEKVLPVPQRVEEPPSLFKQKKKPESAFEEISPEIQPLFQRLDDALFRKKLLKEEKQWMKLKKWASVLKSKKPKN